MISKYKSFSITESFWGDESPQGFRIPHEAFIEILTEARNLYAQCEGFNIREIFENKLQSLDIEYHGDWKLLSEYDQMEFLTELESRV